MAHGGPPQGRGRGIAGIGRGVALPQVGALGGVVEVPGGVPQAAQQGEQDEFVDDPEARIQAFLAEERARLGLPPPEGVFDPRRRPNRVNIHRSSAEYIRRAVHVTEREEAVEYPSLWFITHPDAKPKVLYKKWDIADSMLRRTVINGFLHSSLELSIVIQYLVYILPRYTHVLEKNWISYGREIGLARTEVNPLSCLEIQAERQEGAAGALSEVDYPDLAVILLITAQYRVSVMMNRAAQPGYITQVRERIRSLAPQVGVTQVEIFDKTLADVKVWAQDPNLRKLMAAINMFIEKTWHDELSVVRIGTLVSKGRDCAVIGDLLRLQRLLGLCTEETLKWCFSPLLEVEVEAMTDPDEEYWDEQGYFFYMADMGLSKKSPYSGSVNPRMHFILNAIAYFLDGMAAPTTRWIECSKVQTLLNAAILAGYALKTPGGVAPFVSETPEEKEMVELILQRTENDAGLADEGAPRVSDWATWVMYFEQIEWKLTPQIREWALRFRRPAGQVRPGSLAEKMNFLLETL